MGASKYERLAKITMQKKKKKDHCHPKERINLVPKGYSNECEKT